MQDFSDMDIETVRFEELVERFGRDNARDILRTLERLEGIHENIVAEWSLEERLSNVFRSMLDSKIYQTRH